MTVDTLPCILRLPDPQQLHAELPLSLKMSSFVARARRSVCNILDGIDSRLLLIIGPCSIHDIDAALEYASRLQSLQQSISRYFFPVMRVYFEKPRTSMGWKGFLSDPHLDGSQDILSGIQLTRQLLTTLASIELPVATEFLDPLSLEYFGELVSWGCIGARTVESPIHRRIASAAPMPIAFKNSTSGDVKVAINAITVAKYPDTFGGVDRTGQLAIINSRGNPHGHLVLRGSELLPNYDEYSITAALSNLEAAQLPRRLLVDCSHGNSGRRYEKQPEVFKAVLEQYMRGNRAIRGLMLESNLCAGNQLFLASPSQQQYGVSLTDGCIDWNMTEELLHSCCTALARCRS